MSPIVSVLMSVYNSERHLRQSIQSVLDQSFADFEFVIVEDGSEDSSPRILSEFARQDARIVLIKNETNRGLAASLNRGLERAQGKYVARQDADDISLPNRLELQSAYLETHPEIGILGSACTIIDEEGKELGVYPQPEGDLLIRWTSLWSNPFIHPSIMLRRETLEKHRLRYDETFASAQDYELWSRLLQYTQAANLPEPLIRYRIHRESVTRTRREAQLLYHDQVVLRNIARQLPSARISTEQIRQARRWIYPDEGGAARPKEISTQAVHLYLNLLTAFIQQYSGSPDLSYLKNKTCQQAADLILTKPLPKGWLGILRRLFTVSPQAAWNSLSRFVCANYPACRYPLKAVNKVMRVFFKEV